MATTALPSPKRIKLSDNVKNSASESDEARKTNLPIGFSECQRLLSTTLSSPTPSIPSSLLSVGKTKNDLNKVRRLFDAHGFRTSVITSPRPALSIYKDSCHIEGQNDQDSSATAALAGKKFLLAMLGMHPEQLHIERWYSQSAKSVYCLLLFCNRIRVACSKAISVDEGVERILQKYETLCRSIASMSSKSDMAEDNASSPKVLPELSPVQDMYRLSVTVLEKVAELINAVVKADPRIRSQQLQREYERITLLNSTYANAMVQLFLGAHNCCIKDVYFKRSHVPKYERITVYLYDPEIDELKPPRFTFLPSLRRALDDGPTAIVDDMITTFWNGLLRHGYFATEKIQSELTPELKNFFISGIANDLTIPLHLNAHFTPKYPLSLYFYGKAGAGKSSLVRNFSPALNAAIEKHADPEILVRFVKQNLNKPQQSLELELELRPNNNDLSVMSIIQGRRMTMSQSKPGLVVVNLEEMASNAPDANPNQLTTCQLISQRFSGRNGDYSEESKAPRNSAKRGISGDASLLTLFTSNYMLEPRCLDALQRLEMFSNIKIVEMKAVSGDDRVDFARTYIKQCVQDYFHNVKADFDINLNIPVGDGDTRPLVRHLRMLAFFICALATENARNGSSIVSRVTHDSTSHIITVNVGERRIRLKVGTLNNLFPLCPKVFDPRAGATVDELKKRLPSTDNFQELSQIIDFYFAKTLAPAVIVSNNENLIKELVSAVAAQRGVHFIAGIVVNEYKMMRSLYDPNDTPNLRDDILHYGRGAYVAVELKCQTANAQLCIREMIEDSPSMTAFSTNKSALYKSGLLFGVYVLGEITPEVRSRASLIL